ncbi:hypothetical protein ADL26_15480, partial [Thermoactinomyces vulgaris]
MDPLGEGLPFRPGDEVAPGEAFHIVAEVGRGDLEAAGLASQARRGGVPAAEVDLEALDLLAVLVGDELALEADVAGLGAGAGVGAAVDVDGDRHVEFGDALLELGDEVAGAVLGVDDGELAELDA